jgi:hypothetical protein
MLAIVAAKGCSLFGAGPPGRRPSGVTAVRKSAAASKIGSFFARFTARRSIPTLAFELKKYVSGIGPVSSTSDKEDTLAALRNAAVLGVEQSPRHCSLGSKHITSVRPSAPWRDERAILSGQRAE